MKRACFLVFALGAAIVAACSDGADQQSLTGLRHSNGAATDPGAEPDDPSAEPSSTSSPSETDDAGGAASDASSTSTTDGGAKTDAGKSACIDGVASPGSGRHHAGDDCLNCHDTQSKQWTSAGTLYSAATGGTAVAGATIEVVDAKGKVVKLTTYSNGNFYTTTSVTKPLKVRATKCPADLPMVGAVNDGSCNGCHDSSMRIHL